MISVGMKDYCRIAGSEVQLRSISKKREDFLINVQQVNTLRARRRSAFPTILGLAAVVFALDQATKYLVLQNIPENESWSFFPALARIFRLTHITNDGAAFGAFSDAGVGNIFKIIAVIVVIAIFLFYYFFPTEFIGVRVSLGLIVGGAMGNLLDRFVHENHVVDFIDIGFWPIFNLADLSIVVGVSVLAYYLWSEDNPHQRRERLPLSEGGEL
jgi:signal peptidase II